MQKNKQQSLFGKWSDPTSIIYLWHCFQKWPAGKWLFSKLIGCLIPYTGSISPLVKSINPGDVFIEIRDRRSIRNHLKSIHAIALANAGEFASGLALFSRAPKNMAAIIVKLDITYLKKARGNLVAHATLAETVFQNDTDIVITTNINNAENETVAMTQATWRIRLLT